VRLWGDHLTWPPGGHHENRSCSGIGAHAARCALATQVQHAQRAHKGQARKARK